MPITQAQVDDLRVGDVVELRDSEWPEGTILRGPLWIAHSGCLVVGGQVVRHTDATRAFAASGQDLTVISRAPRPYYVNLPHLLSCASGDVARRENGDVIYNHREVWYRKDGDRTSNPVRSGEQLTLLVDGDTGKVVQ